MIVKLKIHYEGDIRENTLHDGREKTAIEKIALNKNIKINYDKTKKFANYNRNYANWIL